MEGIQSQRLVIREYSAELSEVNAVFAFTGDMSVAAHSSWGPLSLNETVEWLSSAVAAQSVSPRMVYELAVVLKSNDDLIGKCSLHIRNLANGEAELGYAFRRDCWGQGFATEAAAALVTYGFQALGLHRIFASTSPENIASHRVLEKAGMRREGVLRGNVLQRGQWRDSVVFGILEGDV